MPHRVLLRIEPNGYVLTGRAGPQKIVHGTGDDETRLAAALAGARAIEPRPVQLSVAVGDGTADDVLDHADVVSEVQRAVVTLRYQEDLDPSEICRIVGLPVNTVKSHLHRALQSLRRKLENRP